MFCLRSFGPTTCTSSAAKPAARKRSAIACAAGVEPTPDSVVLISMSCSNRSRASACASFGGEAALADAATMVATTGRIVLRTRLFLQAQLASQLGGSQIACIHLAADVEVLRTRQPADDDRIEACVTHQTLGDLERLAIVARERDGDALAGTVR